MNLALHRLLLQVILLILQLQHDFLLCSAGEPGYLDFDNLPETNFSCQGKVIGGYYADVEAGCQMFHVCTIGQKDEIMDIKFLCLNGTVFDQETRVCERVDEVDCSKSERFYNLNLELYGNNAVTLSLHEGEDENEDTPVVIEDHQGSVTTSAQSSTSTTSTTTQRAIISSTTAASGSYQHPSGYPQHYQPQPPFPSLQTSQSKSLYDDKNGGYHRQYIYHVGNEPNVNVNNNNNNQQNNNNNQQNNNNNHHQQNNHNSNNNNNNNNNDNRATSYQIFSNQGASSTTGAPQVHQIHYSSTSNSQVSINGNDASSIFHPTSSTIQSLLNVNGNSNNPSLINPIFHNGGTSSSTEHYNNARETVDYQTETNSNDQDDEEDDDDDDASRDENQDRRYLEPIQASNQGKVSKLTTSSGVSSHEGTKSKITQSQLLQHQQHSRIPTGFLTIAQMNSGGAPRPFFPPPKPTGKTTHQSQTSHVTQHIHIPPVPPIPQLKPHQVTINLPPPDIQRIVSQNPSPLLPSQSRVIVTAKASVSDESGRPLNSTQLVTLPLPTIPASYDDYKEGDESFDPFYRDVPKIRNTRRSYAWEAMENFRRFKRSIDDVKVGTPMSYDEEYADVSENNDTKLVEVDNKDYLNDDDGDYNFEGSYEVEGEKEEVDGREELPVAEKQVDLVVKVEGKNNISEVDGDEFNIDKNLTALTNINLNLNLNLNMNNESDDSKVEEEGEEEDYISSEEYSQVPATEYDLLIDEQDDELSNITELIVTEMINNSTEITITTDYPTTVKSYDVSEVRNNEDSEKKTDGDEDGVLKFTDEIPMSGNADYDKEDEDKVEQVIESVPVSSMPMDYVDDNYEPQHYQDQKISLSANVTTEDDDGRVKAEEENNSTAIDDNFKADVDSSTGIFISFTTPDTTSTSTMSSTSSTTPETTSSSSTTTTTTTTTTTSTTTSKPPKTLFKPITTRKNYNYIPPTTTPAPVVIKTRLPLLNPKPAKPPKSYNEIAPKPVIRKVPLVAKRVTTMRNIEVESTTNSVDLNKSLPEEIEANFTSYSSSTSTTTEVPMTVTSTVTESTEKSAEMLADAAVTSSSEETKVEISTTSAPELGKKYFTVRKPIDVFNCLNVDLYRFYADKRDCRLFHYCSPGFTSRQVLDFRFVCEEGTVFDEISQSCVYQIEDSKCRKKVW